VYVVGDAGAPASSCAGGSFLRWTVDDFVAAVQKEYARVVVVLTRQSIVRCGAMDFGYHQHPRPNHNPSLRKSRC
jgi:hypothetical protein